MLNAVDALLADHKMINKLLGQLHRENNRLGIVSQTISRVVKAHAWFEDNVFFPAFEGKELLDEKFVGELTAEHKDIEHLLGLLGKTPIGEKELWESRNLQFKTLMKSHFLKEEEAIFPLAAQILPQTELHRLGEEMQRRQAEVSRSLEG